jgi:hypothetical protein
LIIIFDFIAAFAATIFFTPFSPLSLPIIAIIFFAFRFLSFILLLLIFSLSILPAFQRCHADFSPPCCRCRHYADIFMPPLSPIAFDSSPFSFLIRHASTPLLFFFSILITDDDFH